MSAIYGSSFKAFTCSFLKRGTRKSEDGEEEDEDGDGDGDGDGDCDGDGDETSAVKSVAMDKSICFTLCVPPCLPFPPSSVCYEKKA